MKFSCCISSLNPNPVWLKTALKSAAPFDEVILHVDQRTKRMPDVSKFENVKLVRLEKDTTHAEGMNFAISKASGEWISCLTDNDFYETKNLEIMLHNFDHSQDTFRVLYFPYYVLQDRRFHVYWPPFPFSAEMLLKTNFIAHPTLFRKKDFEDIGGFRDTIFNDWDLWMRFFKGGRSFSMYKLPIWNYRQHPNSSCKKIMETHTMEEVREQLGSI